MGLLDVLNGMQNGPRGQRQPNPGGSSGGMSPLTMALLGLLAYKALKHFGGAQQQGAPSGTGTPRIPQGNPVPGGNPRIDQTSLPGGSGGLGDLLKGGLGGLLAGGAAGSVLSGGLNDLLKQLQQAGQGDVADSWVGRGQNKQISPRALEDAIGSDTINSLAEQAGLSRVELLSGLSQQLPDMVDHLTPDGRLPTEEEMSRMI
jgi:uncharacterized protein YidB (DUF937 family)